MTYATAADMSARFEQEELIQLTDLAELGVIDQARLATVLGEAASTINASVAVRYSLPLAEIPSVLVDVACDIARYRLYRSTAPEQVTERWKAALKFLDKVANGQAQLQAAGPPPAAASGGAQIVSNRRRFTRDTMEGL